MARRWVFPTALVLTAMAGTAHAAERPAGEGPFGLAWGPVDRIDTPSMVDREANLTGLYYLHDRPLASGPDTVEVMLVVCREEGLQQVVWVGRPLADEAHLIARDAVRREGGCIYGEPRPGPLTDRSNGLPDEPYWRTRAMPDGTRGLVMSASGPDYAACSESHRAATPHPADAHVADLLRSGVP
ncbi:hypothetical protein AFCDBAGC_5096 [Methylobacterium cerastii]|uniref:Threonyl-trna synthetase n=1 Tax=Methylobacterium cerastii TaxID=932741 RepID=A0ABQ4QQN6_9HYPH|nr:MULTISPECIES: threonyl-trna synthetase [Methylobacterium]TXN83155.1 threonyl-trna synthetase [Methylobacterium sp. WL8]GJD47210.1 hypothetical protein AFCDBAGC_5096 [Methylobacterium cerastii]